MEGAAIASPTGVAKGDKRIGLVQHHELLAPVTNGTERREAWRIHTRVAALRKDGSLDDADHVACERFQRDWDIGIEGVSEGGSLERVDCAGGISGPADRQVDALSDLRAVQDAIGPTAMLLLEMAIAKDASWVETGRRIGCSDKTARQRATVAIKALTAHYAEADRGSGKTCR